MVLKSKGNKLEEKIVLLKNMISENEIISLSLNNLIKNRGELTPTQKDIISTLSNDLLLMIRKIKEDIVLTELDLLKEMTTKVEIVFSKMSEIIHIRRYKLTSNQKDVLKKFDDLLLCLNKIYLLTSADNLNIFLQEINLVESFHDDAFLSAAIFLIENDKSLAISVEDKPKLLFKLSALRNYW